MPTSKSSHMHGTFTEPLTRNIFLKAVWGPLLDFFSGFGDLISIPALFCVKITAVDKHFLQRTKTVLYLRLSAADLPVWCKKKKKSQTIVSQWGQSREQVSFSFFGFYELQRSIFALQPSKCFPGRKRLWQPRYAPQQYTGVCLQPRRPLYKPAACTTAASPRSSAPSWHHFMLPLPSSQNGISIFNLLTRAYEAVNHNRREMCQL